MQKKVKNAPRIKTDSFDDEIKDIIIACKKDLELVGINIKKTKDPLLTRAIILYAKAHFGFNADSEKYQKAYEHLKCAMSLAGDYRGME